MAVLPDALNLHESELAKRLAHSPSIILAPKGTLANMSAVLVLFHAKKRLILFSVDQLQNDSTEYTITRFMSSHACVDFCTDICYQRGIFSYF